MCVCVCVCLQGECDQSFGSEFLFSDHGKELIVGEIFVRVYNEQPMFPLEVRDVYTTVLKHNNMLLKKHF